MKDMPIKPKVRNLVSEDLFRIELITEAYINNSGDRVCFVKKVFKPEKNKYQSNLWTISITKEKLETQQLTVGDFLDHSPSWSPDGRWIAFLSNRSGINQIWTIPAGGGNYFKVTSVKGVSSRPAWSPDGQSIAFTLKIGAEGVLPEEEKQKSQSLREKYTSDIRTINTLPYKENGVGFLDGRFSQVAVVSVNGSSRIRIMTQGNRDYEDPVWSPNGRFIAFSINEWKSPGNKLNLLPIGDIGIVPAGGGEVRKLTVGKGSAARPSFSPDGKNIAYIGDQNEYGSYTQPSLWTVSVGGGSPNNIAAGFDRPLGDHSLSDLYDSKVTSPPTWSADGQAIYYLASDQGATHLLRVETSGKAQFVTRGKRVFYNFSINPTTDNAVLCCSDPLTPNDLILFDLGNGSEHRITSFNQKLLAEVKLTPPQGFTVRSGNVEVDGWVIRPPEAHPLLKQPAVLQIHGGPTTMYGYRFFFEFQLLAANGITVIYSNPRGSMGYGQDFTAAIRADWGNKDYQDLMKVTQEAVARWGIDPNRLGVAGGSYGGFMVNWIVGHTDRFRAAVSMRSISDLYSFFGTSDFGFTDLEDFNTPPWRNPRIYLDHSPISFVDKVNTPLLMIHSEKDLRTPMSEAEQFYTALKVRGQEVTLIYYPGENHELSREGQPWHRVHRLESIVLWFTRYLKPVMSVRGPLAPSWF